MLLRILLVALFLLLNGCARQPASRQPDAAAQQHIRRLATLLPPGNRYRDLLDQGWHGDGRHESWMDEMHKFQVKGAMVEVHGVRFSHVGFLHPWFKRVMYFSSYAGPDAQITDPRILQ